MATLTFDNEDIRKEAYEVWEKKYKHHREGVNPYAFADGYVAAKMNSSVKDTNNRLQIACSFMCSLISTVPDINVLSEVYFDKEKYSQLAKQAFEMADALIKEQNG